VDAFNQCNAAVDEANDIIDKTGERYEALYIMSVDLCLTCANLRFLFQKLARKAQENAQKVKVEA
jgi:hypothetical protein